MIQVEGHSMMGYGYDENGNIYIYDTWNPGVHIMPWGGSYSGMTQWGVVCSNPAAARCPCLPACS